MEKIKPDKWYAPMTIAKNGWVKYYTGNEMSSYYHILALIKKKKIKYRNFGLGKTPYYRILGSRLIEYLNSIK